MPSHPVLWDSTRSMKESQPSYGIGYFPAWTQVIQGEACAKKQCAAVPGLWDSTQGICERQPSYGGDCLPSIMPGNPLGSLRFVQHDIQEDCTQPSHHYRLPAY